MATDTLLSRDFDHHQRYPDIRGNLKITDTWTGDKDTNRNGKKSLGKNGIRPSSTVGIPLPTKDDQIDDGDHDHLGIDRNRP